MSRLDESDLISKFINALTIFSERSAALENRVLTEMGAMRSDIEQLKLTISNEHNTVSLPSVMEQQRMTMVEVIRQIQPILAARPAETVKPVELAKPAETVKPAEVAKPAVTVKPPVETAKSVEAVKPPVEIAKPVEAAKPTTDAQSTKSFGEQFKLKEGEWYCSRCCVKNGANTNTCVCCTTPKGGAEKPAEDVKPKPVSFSFTPTPPAQQKPSFGTGAAAPSGTQPQPSFGTGAPATSAQSKPVFGQPLFGTGGAAPSAQTKPVSFSFTPTSPAQTPPSFGTGAAAPSAQPKTLFGAGAASSAQPKPSFGNVAASVSAQPKALFGTGAASPSAQPKPLFGTTTTTASPAQPKPWFGNAAAAPQHGEDEDAPEEYVPDDSQFKRPDIALPDLIDVKTGEENEETIFNARCRLYRFQAGNEVKERGTGDMKLLRSKETGKVRCVMRREQVLKVCANFSIPPDFEVHSTRRGENVLTWSCKDFSDPEQPEGEMMTLICRFKDVETAKRFKEAATQSSA